MTTPAKNAASQGGLKLHPRYTPAVFAFYMSGIMAFLMSCIIVAVQTGVAPGYWSRALHSYIVAMPVAFVCVLLVRPLVMRLVALTVRH